MKTQVQSLKSHWYVWLFPIAAILISGWLFADYYKKRGPRITIAFSDGSSLDAEKTRVRFRGVTIGLVKKVTISEDGKDVLAHVNLQKDAEHFAVEGTKFWLVMPKVNLQGISGLETLLQGTYISAVPGSPTAEAKTQFKGRLGSENTESLEETSSYTLETPNAESTNPGDAVSFRGMNIGSVSKVTLGKSGQTILVQINIKNAYTRLIRTNSVFWRKVGIQAKLGLFNSEVKVNSMDSILHGGIEVFTPDPPGEISKAQARFDLSAAPPKDSEKWNPKLE